MLKSFRNKEVSPIYIEKCIFTRSTFKSVPDSQKCLTRKVQGIFLIQNITIFLVESFIFTVIFYLWVKNTDKVDPSEKIGLKAMFFMIPLCFRFSPAKWDLQQKMNKSNRKLVKLWTRTIPPAFLFKFFIFVQTFGRKIWKLWR